MIMKKLLLIAVVSVFSAAVMAQAKPEEVVKFTETKHDFGKIKQGVPVTYDFVFSNISKKPLVVTNATASCGCTTPKWPQEAVSSTKSEKINVGYNAASLGAFSKTITVNLAGVEAPVTLTISGEVVTPEAFDSQSKNSKPSSKSK
jgi:hypothetical protein